MLKSATVIYGYISYDVAKAKIEHTQYMYSLRYSLGQLLGPSVICLASDVLITAKQNLGSSLCVIISFRNLSCFQFLPVVWKIAFLLLVFLTRPLFKIYYLGTI
jgi:hypothetical protein